jgi:DNA-binding NarL/FixJ family response regulator
LFREGIHFTLSGEEDIDVIGEATSSDDALKAMQANPPDVAVLNANHEDFAGIRATRYLRQNIPSVAVLLLIDSRNDEYLFQAMKSGARACLTKEADPVEMIDTIRAVAQGSQPIAEAMVIPEIASRTLAEFEQFAAMGKQVDNLLPTLTQGETDLLRRIAQGSAVEQVARGLNIGREDMSQHFGRILVKLVTNDHIRQVMAAAQDGRLADVFRARAAGKPKEEYITRDEFAAFRDSIWERFRAAIDEIK